MCVCVSMCVCARAQVRACMQGNDSALASALLLIGKYRNARNIEHLDGTTSVAPPQRSSCRTKRCTMQRRLQEEGRVWVARWVLVWVWRRFFRRQASTAPTVLVKRIRRLSRDWEWEPCPFCLRDIWVTSNFAHVKKVIRGPGPMIVPAVECSLGERSVETDDANEHEASRGRAPPFRFFTTEFLLEERWIL